MTRRCGLRLRERDVPLRVINRTLDSAQELAAELGATALSLSDFRADPAAYPCAALVCASGATEPVIDRALLVKLASARPLLMDFGLPPNVDLDAARVLDFARVGMDDLVQTARDGRVEHLLRLAPVRAAIDAHLGRLRGELAARAIGPQLARLRDDFEHIAAGEVDRLLREVLPDLDETQRRQLSGWGRTLAHRLAHLPLSGLRAAAEHAGPEVTEAFFREARLSRKADAGDTE
jgi:glutamyl-tRNA reductase